MRPWPSRGLEVRGTWQKREAHVKRQYASKPFHSAWEGICALHRYTAVQCSRNLSWRASLAHTPKVVQLP